MSDETTKAHFDPNPPAPQPKDGEPKRPEPKTGTGTGGGFEPTTRTPVPKVVTAGGWVGGSGPPIVEHITDWWYRGPDGRTTFLGSTVNEKTKKE